MPLLLPEELIRCLFRNFFGFYVEVKGSFENLVIIVSGIQKNDGFD
jgi:hypothetical protein